MFFLLFQILLLLPLSLAGVLIVETNQTFSATKIFYVDWTNETVECVTANSPNVTQKYIYLPQSVEYYYAPDSLNHCVNFNNDVKAAQDRGAIGVLFIGTSKYVGFLGLLYQADSDIVIPVVEVSVLSKNTITPLVKSNNSIHVRVISDPNIFIEYVHSPGKYIFQISMIIWWLSIAILAIVKLVQIMSAEEGLKLNLATSCVFLELFCCLLRVLQNICSPMRWNETIPIPGGLILNTIPLPFEISSCILLMFFWLDMAKARLKESRKMLGKFQHVGIILCCFLFLIEISLDTVNLTIGIPNIINTLTGIYISLALIFGIVYQVAAIRLWIFSSKIMRRRQMRYVTIKVQISGVAALIATFLALAQLLVDRSPTGTAVFWGFIWIALGTKCIAQILVFGTPKRKLNSRTKSKLSE